MLARSEVMMNYSAFRVSSIGAWMAGRIRQTVLAGAALSALWLAAACASTPGSGPHATVLMRDGSTLTGTVTATSAAEITLRGDDNATHTVPMTQVKSIEYDDAAAGQPS